VVETFRRVVVSCLVVLGVSASAFGELRVGAASVKMTPEGPVPLAGYGARWGGMDMKKSTGVHDDMYARALVLDDGKTKIALVSTDLCVINAGLRQGACRLVEKANIPIPLDNIMVSGTHSHAAVGGYILSPLAPPVAGFFTPAIFDKLAKGIAEAIEKAHAALAPATFGSGVKELEGYNRNRRGNPTLDKSMTELRFDGKDGKPIALVVNFTAHPTIVDGEDMQVSREWPGAMVDAVREAFGGSTEVLFFNGAEGDASPSVNGGPQDRYERAVYFGKKVSEPAIELAKSIKATEQPELKIAFNRFKLPPSILGKITPTSTYTHRIQIGKTWLMGLPGEAIMRIGLDVKEQARKLGAETAVALGLSDDHLMYFVTAYQLPKGGYEVTMNMYGPDIEKTLIRGLFGDLLGPAESDAGLLAGGQIVKKDGAMHVRLAGSHYQMGYQHGKLLKKEVQGTYEALGEEVVKYVEPQINKLLGNRPEVGALLKLIPGGSKTLIMPFMALLCRPLHAQAPPELLEEMCGLAEGAEIPYDGVFLMNGLLTLMVQEDFASLLKSVNLCTNIVRVPEQADRPVIHVRNVDWNWPEKFAPRTMVFEYRPAKGNAFLSATFPGQVGVLTAINDKQISLGNETVNSRSDRSMKGMCIMMNSRMAIQYDATLDAMVKRLRETPGVAGMHVMMGDGQNRAAVAVDRSAQYSAVRKPEKGVLLGVVLGKLPEPYVSDEFKGPGITTIDEGERAKYTWLTQILADGSVKLETPEDWANLMIRPDNNLCAASTIHTTVMVPSKGELWLHRCIPSAGSSYERFTLSAK